MDDKEKHFWATDKKRRANLMEELPVWEQIIGNNDIQIQYSSNNFSVSYKGKKGGYFQKKIKSLCSKIWRVNSEEYNLKKPNDLKFKHLEDFVKKLVKSPKHIQLYFCTEPTRQSLNQKIQIQILKEILDKNIWTITHPKEGDINIDGRNIVTKDKHSKGSRDARSVDVVIKPNKKYKSNIVFYGFNKFSGPKGTATTIYALSEVKRWLKSAMKYCDEVDNEYYFFAQLDGEEAERNFPELNKIIQRYKDRIFINNSSSIAFKIKKYEKKL